MFQVLQQQRSKVLTAKSGLSMETRSGLRTATSLTSKLVWFTMSGHDGD
jgi:hypothetical protein